MKKSVFSDYDKMKEAIDSTSSIKDAMWYLGRVPSGGNYKHFRGWAEKHGLTIKRGPRSVVGSQFRRKHTNEDMFSVDSPCDRGMVRDRIISDNLLSYICTLCGNEGVHNNLPLSLHLDHLNGVNTDHRLENLRFLCPNCHSQTDTYGGKNTRKHPIEHRKLSRKNGEAGICSSCGTPIHYGYDMCNPCSGKARRKIDWPSTDELLDMLEQKSYASVGRFLGVSDNAVRKYLKSEGVEPPKKHRPVA